MFPLSALILKLGAGGEPTLTVTLSLADPPEPVQVRIYVRVEVKLPVLLAPFEGEIDPPQEPDAVQEVAFETDQRIVVELP